MPTAGIEPALPKETGFKPVVSAYFHHVGEFRGFFDKAVPPLTQKLLGSGEGIRTPDFQLMRLAS